MRLLLLVNLVSAIEDRLEERSACLSEGECVADSWFGNFTWYRDLYCIPTDDPVTTIDAYQVYDIVDLASCQNECINHAGCYQMHYKSDGIGHACTLFNDLPQVADETFSTKLKSCDSDSSMSPIHDFKFDTKFYSLFTLADGQIAEEFLAYLNLFYGDWRFVVNKNYYLFIINYAYTYRYKYVIADSVPSRYSAAGANQVWIAFQGEYYVRFNYLEDIESRRRRRDIDFIDVLEFIQTTAAETATEFQGTIDAGDATVVATTEFERTSDIEAVNTNSPITTTTTATTTTTTTTTTSTTSTTPAESSAVFMGFNLVLSAIFVCL